MNLTRRLPCLLFTLFALVSGEASAQTLDVLWQGGLSPNVSSQAWLAGDMDGDDRTDILHPRSINGTLALDVYQSTGGSYVHAFNNNNMGQGANALAWLTGDMDGDGRTDILQPWSNGTKLGLIVYRSTGTGYVTGFASANMGAGSAGARGWLTGDADGDGRTDLIHLWHNSNVNRLGINVYRSTGTGYVLWFANGNMGQGSGSLKWLAGDMDGDGLTDIFQPFQNGTQLGLIAYRATGTGYAAAFVSPNMGQGWGNLDLLVGDMDDDGRTDIFQPFSSGTKVGLIAYRSTGTGFATEFVSTDMGVVTAGTAAWRAADIDGDGRTDIWQPRNNGGMVEVNVYVSNGTGFSLGHSRCCFGQLSWVGWLTGKFYGGNREHLLHLWNPGSLALVVYGLAFKT